MAKKNSSTIGPIHTAAAGAVKTFNHAHRTEARGRGKVQAMHNPRALTEAQPGRGMGLVHGAGMESVGVLYRGKKRMSRKGV
jgi:hypothetical protein